MAEGARGRAPPTTLHPPDLERLLGPPRYPRSERPPSLGRAGVALGLAWTSAGGELLFIETSRMAGSGQLILTGQQGEVMKESVRTALSWIRSHTQELGIGAPAEVAAAAEEEEEEEEGGAAAAVAAWGQGGSREASLLARTDIHVHFPAASIRKDGPSAGATVLVALTSLLTGRMARSDTAMSGEVSLRGKVLPVGGVREKVLAAHRASVRRVLLPRQNRKDLQELPEKIRAEMDFIWCDSIEQLLNEALVNGASTIAAGAAANTARSDEPSALPVAATAAAAATAATAGATDEAHAPPLAASDWPVTIATPSKL
jgi:ATP-dependent Lon protease